MTAVLAREQTLVELVTPSGLATGSATVLAAHTAPGLLHRAFSVLLIDPAGRTLLQRRAAAKTRFPLRWANSCCGHPAPGESVVAAAGRRLGEEIGSPTAAVTLTEIGVYVYRALDPATGLVEHEYDHVLIGRVPADLAVEPDPAEVAQLRWTGPAELAADIDNNPDSYAPWLSGVLKVTIDS